MAGAGPCLPVMRSFQYLVYEPTPELRSAPQPRPRRGWPELPPGPAPREMARMAPESDSHLAAPNVDSVRD